MAEFVYELYIKEDPQCAHLAGSHKNLIIAFLLKINMKLSEIKLDSFYFINKETKLYIYRLVQIFTGIFSNLKEMNNISSITDKSVIEFINFVGLIIDRISYLRGYFDLETFHSFGKFIQNLEVYDMENEYYSHKNRLLKKHNVVEDDSDEDEDEESSSLSKSNSVSVKVKKKELGDVDDKIQLENQKKFSKLSNKNYLEMGS